MSEQTPQRELPEPVVRKARRGAISVVWVVPVVAALAAAILGIRGYLASGPSIVIDFSTAEGIESGKTEVRYKEVPIGKVRRIELTDDRKGVRVHVDLVHDAETAAVADSRWWVVKPRVGLGGVSGLGTLISGAYIGVDIGKSTEQKKEFEGLEKPPSITSDQKGKRFLLRTADLGSLDVGSPVLYRRIQVGHIVDRELDADGRHISMQLFVDEPYDRYVTENTRFWNASGVDVSVDAGGLKLNTQSVATVLAGGIAFQAFPEEQPGKPAAENTRFELFDDRNVAGAPSLAESEHLRLRFYQSTRGLAPNSPVEFQGLQIGRVESVALDYDRDRHDFWTDVVIAVYPRNLGRAFESWQKNTEREPKNANSFFRSLIERGLRGQLRTGNLISGQLYVALEFDPKARKNEYTPPADQNPLEVPTMRGEFDQIQEQLGQIVDKLQKIPFDEIGKNLNNTLKSADELVKRLDGKVVPELQATVNEAKKTLGSANEALADDGRLQHSTRDTLDEVGRAARSLRTLSDYLQRHPESLIRGRKEPPPLEPAAPLPSPPAIEPASPPAAPVAPESKP